MADFINKLLGKVFGDKSEKDIKAIKPLVAKAIKEQDSFKSLSLDELRAKGSALKKEIQDYIQAEENEVAELRKKVDDAPQMELEEKEAIYNQIDNLTASIDKKLEEVLKKILPQSFALVKETARRFKENERLEVSANDFDREMAAKRDNIEIDGDKAIYHNSWDAAGAEVTWDMEHYEVQLIGGIVLHQGKIAEMMTGEGKTLVSTLPVFLNALAGKGVHVVTVNDYLAKRDSEWNAPIYEFHGMSVDCIDKYEPHSPGRIDAYKASITYGTNNEFGFDYLRDNMAQRKEDIVQGKHHFAIVDEVDSVLIDDARTPLIISGPTTRPTNDEEYVALKPRIEMLVNEQRKFVTQRLAEAKKVLTDENYDEEAAMALLRAYRGLPKNRALIKFLSEPGIKMHLQKIEGKYLENQQKDMHKVDAELLFVIDEKTNSVELTEKGIDSLSGGKEENRNFFILPDIAIELDAIEKSGQADEVIAQQKNDLINDYSIKAQRIHSMNQLLKAYTMFEKDQEYVVMDNKVKIVDEQTGRIMDGRRYSDGLHQAIEAKENVKVEASTQTYATITLQNYFRMYHKLAGMTGTAITEAGEFWDIYELDVVEIPTNRPIARDDRQDLVYKTQKEKFNAAIEEIVSLTEAGRPVLVGTTSVEVSELLGRMLKLRKIKHQILNAKRHAQEAQIVAEAGKSGTVTIATNMAGRGTDIKLSDEVKAAGGLAIIATERHDSRRVDRQLRGRSGRQGDPGSSQFFVSLEDQLMRLFISDKVAKMMDKMGLKEGEVIQHGMVTKSIERAQKKVEENNFAIRKRLLEFDDVMNNQRTAVYRSRKNALFGERLEVDILNMFHDVCEQIVDTYLLTKDFDGFKVELISVLSMESPFSEEEFFAGKNNELAEKLFKVATETYRKKQEALATQAFPVIENVFLNEGDKYQNISIPISDGKRFMPFNVNLEKAYNTQGFEINKEIERVATLSNIDEVWKEHLRAMDDLKQSVNNATIEQKDPLLIYKFESFELFKGMLTKMRRAIVSYLMHSHLPTQEEQEQINRMQQAAMQQQLSRQQEQARQKVQTNQAERVEAAAETGNAGQAPRPSAPPKKQEPVRAEKRVGRNDPCPCGSGKKYKQCHGKVG